jgi:hypothetical protein
MKPYLKEQAGGIGRRISLRLTWAKSMKPYLKNKAKRDGCRHGSSG